MKQKCKMIAAAAAAAVTVDGSFDTKRYNIFEPENAFATTIII